MAEGAIDFRCFFPPISGTGKHRKCSVRRKDCLYLSLRKKKTLTKHVGPKF